MKFKASRDTALTRILSRIAGRRLVALLFLAIAMPAYAVPPTVAITGPANGSSFDSGVTINFTATAADLEDGNLSGSIAWSSSIDGAIGNGGAIGVNSLSVGVHTITASVTDSEALTATDSITVTINNVAPTVTITSPASGSSFSAGTNIGFQASATDVEDNNGPLTASISWTSSIDGAIGSGGNANVSSLSIGVHTITASVTDSNGAPGSDSITVTITNNAPTVNITAPASGTSVPFGTNINFQGNASDAEDGNLTARIAWSSNLDGALGTGASINVSTLSVGTHTITASVTDNNGGNGTDAISVTITNNAPTVNITAPPNGTTVSFGTNINFQGNASDTEDGNLTPRIAWSSSLDGALGTGGSINVSTLSVGTHTITASVTDDNGGNGSASIGVTITNNAPTVTITAPANGSSVPFGTNVVFQGTANDPEDGDLAPAIAWSSSIDGALGVGASISVSTLSLGTHTITAAVTDSDGSPGSATINVTITNNAPTVTITAPANGTSVPFGTDIAFQGTASDPEDGDLTAGIAWSSDIDGALGTGGTINVSTLSVGAHVITASVSDSDGSPGSAAISITITNNDPTVTITAPANGISVSVGTPVGFQANATDPEDDDVTLTAAITWTSSLDGALGTGGAINVDTLSVGDHVVTAAVTDSNGGSGSASINLTITNDPPVVNGQDPLSTPEDTSLTIVIGNFDVTDTESEPEELTLTVQPGTDYSVQNNTITPALNFNGPLTVNVVVSDPNGGNTPFAATVDVSPVNDRPVISDSRNLTTPEDTSITVQITDLVISDPDSSNFTLALGTGANFTAAGAVVTPAENFNGTLNVPVTVTDDSGEPNAASAPVTLRITVDPVNDLPTVVAPIGSQNAIEDSPFTLDVSVNFDDADNEPLTYTVTFDPALPPERGISFDSSTGQFSGAPDFQDDDPEDPVYTVTVRAEDPQGEFVNDVFDLTISQLGRANLGLTIDVAPETATPSDELRWTFVTNNPVGPSAGENVELTGSFIGDGLAVGVESGASCTINTQVGRVDFDCSVGALPIGETVPVVLSTTTTAVTEVVALATSAGAQRVPIDPNPANNSAVRAVGVAESFSVGAVQLLGTARIRSAAAGDVNGDGIIDIVVGTESGQPVQVWLGAEPRESCDCQRDFVSSPLMIPDTGPNEGVALADFDNNGTLDLVIANNGGQADTVYLNDGVGNFAPGATLSPSNGRGVAVGDFDNDGNADIAIAAASPNLVYFGDGNGGFSSPLQLGDFTSNDVAAGRFDGNDRIDLVFANAGSPSRVYTKNAGSGFDEQASLDIGDTTSVAAADLDGDGLDDLVFGRVPGNGVDVASNPVFLNQGGANFGDPVAELGLSPTNDVLIGDVSDDGQPDLVFVNDSGVHQVWRADGGGYVLHAEQIIDIGAEAGVLAELGQADNADPGGVDLALGGAANAGVGVYLNDSEGNLGRGDAVPPSLTLLGDSATEVPSGTAYVDAGATADDNIDGDITASIVVTNPVNTAVVGTYTVTYNVSDYAGNPAEPVSRTVNVTPASGSGGGGGGAVSHWLLVFCMLMIGWQLRPRRPQRHAIRIEGRSHDGN